MIVACLLALMVNVRAPGVQTEALAALVKSAVNVRSLMYEMSAMLTVLYGVCVPLQL